MTRQEFTEMAQALIVDIEPDALKLKNEARMMISGMSFAEYVNGKTDAAKKLGEIELKAAHKARLLKALRTIVELKDEML